jgi:hypothetical protein
MLAYILTIVASLISIAAYVIYYFDLKKHSIIPSRFSWIIWSLAASLETLTYSYISEDKLKSVCFVTSSLCCVFITLRMWKSSDRKVPNRAETSLTFCTIALVMWLVLQSPFLAHILLLIAIPVVFVPTYKSALSNFKNENSKAWILWSVSDLLTIIIIVSRLEDARELPYAIVEFVCHFTLVAIVFYKQRLASGLKRKYAPFVLPSITKMQ